MERKYNNVYSTTKYYSTMLTFLGALCPRLPVRPKMNPQMGLHGMNPKFVELHPYSVIICFTSAVIVICSVDGYVN